MAYPAPVESLVRAFEALPGVGRVSAERLTFHVLRDAAAGRGLRDGLALALESARRCSVCGNVCEGKLCEVCSDPERDASTLAVVEEPRHVEALERAGVFKGRYHVLMGALNPADGTEERHLAVKGLIRRAQAGGVKEVILATDPDKEGEATALLVLDALESAGIDGLTVSRLARGLPAGSAIEYLHKGVLEDALEDRRAIRRRQG
ncbi:MAG: recombination protein RecR [Planctomycetes bacterium]|nr:recombination protein RecR [Planctomycetota bacterium]